MTNQPTCQDRVQRNLEGRVKDLKTLWELYGEDPEAHNEDLGNMYEYGLCFDYVAPMTFDDQPEGYFRYQLSWGGPSDEFRIYANQSGPYRWHVYKLEYWFLDWFDGAKRHLSGPDRELLEEIFECFFVQAGSANHEYQKALED